MLIKIQWALGAYMIETEKTVLYLRSFTYPIKKHDDLFDLIKESIDTEGNFKTKDISGQVASTLPLKEAVEDLRESYFQYMVETVNK